MKLTWKRNATRSLRGRSFLSGITGRAVTYCPPYFPGGDADDGFRVVQDADARMEK